MTGDAVDHGVGGRETRRDLVVAGLTQHDPGDRRPLAVDPADGAEGETAAGRGSEPVFTPTNPSCPNNVLVLFTVPATGTVTLGVATMLANTGRLMARSTTRTWSAAVDTVASS